MRKITMLFLSILVALMISCEKNDNFDSGNNDENNNQTDTTDNSENEIPAKYLILLATNDTIPLFTSGTNYSDSLRHITQANFKNETYNIAVIFTYRAEPTETFDYTTEADRFFTSQEGAEKKVNLYLTDFINNKNYIVESGNTFSYSVTDTEYGFSADNLYFLEEVNSQESLDVSLKVVFETN